MCYIGCEVIMMMLNALSPWLLPYLPEEVAT